MDSITCALRNEASANCCAPAAARLASFKGFLLARSFIQATNNCASAPSTEAQPKTGLMAKIKAKATSATGASRMAMSAGLAKNSRTTFKSLSTCIEPPTCRFKKP